MLDDFRDRLRQALEGTQRIREIARGLGAFSRVESTEVSLVDVEHAIEHAVNMAFNEIKYRARLVKDFKRVPSVLASDGKIAQVFLNLLINAAHAIPEGDVEGNEIRIRVWADEEQVYAEVSDTGSGIAPEHQTKVFEPFFTTKGVGVGSGLGLAICKSIVTGFGGAIALKSTLGKGTQFLVSLPIATPAPAQSAPGPIEDAESALLRVRGRILVVDDEEGVRCAMTRMLSGDHEVVVAESGLEARSILEKDRAFDLVLFDLMMPHVSGMDLHLWLSKEYPDIAKQVVFVTGGAFTPRAEAYLSSVENLSLEKPLHASNFRKMVRELVLASKGRRTYQ